MKGSLIRTITPDYLELDGFLSEPATEPKELAFLHLHGMFENFHLPLFIQPLYETVTKNNYIFLAANTRAYDYLISCRRWENDKTFSWVQQGGSHEIFSNCLYDIDGWLNYLERMRLNRIILMGHSHGALKAAFYAIRRSEDKRVAGLILISPSDDVGLQKRYLGGRYDEALEIAEHMIKEGEGDHFIPSWAYGNPVSAAMYIDMFSQDSDLAIFMFDEPSAGFTMLESIAIPMLVVYGSDDKATSIVSSQRAIQLIKSSLLNCPSFEGRIIEGANHSYRTRETELALEVVEWAKRQYG